MYSLSLSPCLPQSCFRPFCLSVSPFRPSALSFSPPVFIPATCSLTDCQRCFVLCFPANMRTFSLSLNPSTVPVCFWVLFLAASSSPAVFNFWIFASLNPQNSQFRSPQYFTHVRVTHHGTLFTPCCVLLLSNDRLVSVAVFRKEPSSYWKKAKLTSLTTNN